MSEAAIPGGLDASIGITAGQETPRPGGLAGWRPRWRTIVLVAVDLVLFGVAVLVYVAMRDNWPEVFRQGRRYIDPNVAGIGTAALACSGLTMAGAIWCARRDRRRPLIVLLCLSLLGGIGFVAAKGVEYDTRWRKGLLWSVRQKPTKKQLLAMRQVRAARLAAPGSGVRKTAVTPDAARGKTLFVGTCTSCHGDDAMGLPKLGVALVGSKFVAETGDAALRDFLKSGRGPTDPANTTGVAMPPRGGNPMMTDEKLADIVAYLRDLQKQAPPPALVAAGEAAGRPAPPMPRSVTAHRSVAPPAPDGPQGLATTVRRTTYNTMINQRQAGLDTFFGAYLAVVGLHSLHVLAGLGVLIWLLARAMRGRYNGEHLLAMHLGGLYWLAAGLVWLVLFPLVYC